ncbi:hypothetical protein ACFO0A_10415 [Novosphingobium tardum]|uniref:Uncharacterized protein n=1 Tax=Novosphingobium tardum TaxID=1538021 RepID=A0ABV8RQB1_9SPHN
MDDWTAAVALLEMARTDALEDVESDLEIDLLGMAQVDAAEALMVMPAPHLPALAEKLRTFMAEEIYRREELFVREMVGAMIEDVKRLAGGGHG